MSADMLGAFSVRRM